MPPEPTITLFAPQPRTDDGHLAWLRDRIREEMRDYLDMKIKELSLGKLTHMCYAANSYAGEIRHRRWVHDAP
ncbi:hypothetical protein VTO73DRAFT_10883 [Trametes versicolor]